MEVNSIVICTLNSPKEKIWGLLMSLNAAGISMRGIDINSFDDFVRQVVNQEEDIVGMASVFFPMHRVERIVSDEPSGTLPSLSDQFYKKVGVTIEEYLGLGRTVM
jgi:hypothetical protein